MNGPLPCLCAEYNYQMAFRNRLCYANVNNCLSVPVGCQIFAQKRKSRKVFWYLYSADVKEGSSHCGPRLFIFDPITHIYVLSVVMTAGSEFL